MLPEINVILSGVEGFYIERASTKFILSEDERTKPYTFLNYTQRIIFYKNVKTEVEKLNLDEG